MGGMERALEAERQGDCRLAERLWMDVLRQATPSESDAAVVAQCFAGLGRLAFVDGRPREALVFLDKARSIFLRLHDEAGAFAAVQTAAQCRAALGEFLDVTAQLDMVQFALRLAQFELSHQNYHRCAQVLDCADALATDPVYDDAVDKMRRKLARASRAPVRGRNLSAAEAMDLLDKIQNADLGSVWRRSWVPWAMVAGVGVAIAGALYMLYKPTEAAPND
jgi:hypothetical protein